MSYLNPGLPAPVAAADGLDAPFWKGLEADELHIQRCQSCQKYQWGPEWICHACLSFDLAFAPVSAEGVIYSFERVWHPVHPALTKQGAYLVVLVELPHADNVRLVGNLLGGAEQSVAIGTAVRGVFEHHQDSDAGNSPFTLLQWELKP